MKKNQLFQLAAATLSIACIMASCKKDQTTPNNSEQMTAPQDKMVQTPYGMVPAAQVFEVDNTTTVRITNGRLQKVEIASGKMIQDMGALSKEELTATNPYEYAAKFKSATGAGTERIASAAADGTNYPGYTVSAAASNIKSFSTKWIVPDVPQQASSTVTTFLWNGISRGSLQPVLMWGATAGGAFYAIANWYFLGGKYFHGKYVRVSPGTALQGVITYISDNGTDWVYKESFTGYPAADVMVTRPTEATGVIECWEAYTSDITRWPNDPLVRMKNIKLTTRTGTPPATFNWSVSGGPVTTPSGNNSVIVNSSASNGEIDFYF